MRIKLAIEGEIFTLRRVRANRTLLTLMSMMALGSALLCQNLSAQQRVAICAASSQRTMYASDPFFVPSQLLVHNSTYLWDQLVGPASDTYLREVRSRYPGVILRHDDMICSSDPAWKDLADARRAEQVSWTLTVVWVHWTYSPMRQATHTGGAKPTEAEALYDAENFPGPFEDNQYKTIHGWDSHDCTTKQVTGVAGNSKPSTFYQCTVTFSYSDTASPLAKAAFGKGDTQEAAIAAAKSSANTVLLTGITWGQPLCSSFSTTVKNPYKADYGHSAGSKKENWACEVDFTGNK